MCYVLGWARMCNFCSPFGLGWSLIPLLLGHRCCHHSTLFIRLCKHWYCLNIMTGEQVAFLLVGKFSLSLLMVKWPRTSHCHLLITLFCPFFKLDVNTVTTRVIHIYFTFWHKNLKNIFIWAEEGGGGVLTLLFKYFSGFGRSTSFSSVFLSCALLSGEQEGQFSLPCSFEWFGETDYQCSQNFNSSSSKIERVLQC